MPASEAGVPGESRTKRRQARERRAIWSSDHQAEDASSARTPWCPRSGQQDRRPATAWITVAFTTVGVLVAVSSPFLARARIMLSLVSTRGDVPRLPRKAVGPSVLAAAGTDEPGDPSRHAIRAAILHLLGGGVERRPADDLVGDQMGMHR